MTATALHATRPTAAAPKPRKEADKFVIRLPEGLRPRLVDVAKANYRSMNSEIIERLESSLSKMPVEFDISTISSEEAQLLAAFRSLKPAMRQAVIDLFSAGEGSNPARSN